MSKIFTHIGLFDVASGTTALDLAKMHGGCCIKDIETDKILTGDTVLPDGRTYIVVGTITPPVHSLTLLVSPSRTQFETNSLLPPNLYQNEVRQSPFFTCFNQNKLQALGVKSDDTREEIKKLKEEITVMKRKANSRLLNQRLFALESRSINSTNQPNINEKVYQRINQMVTGNEEKHEPTSPSNSLSPFNAVLPPDTLSAINTFTPANTSSQTNMASHLPANTGPSKITCNICFEEVSRSRLMSKHCCAFEICIDCCPRLTPRGSLNKIYCPHCRKQLTTSNSNAIVTPKNNTSHGLFQPLR